MIPVSALVRGAYGVTLCCAPAQLIQRAGGQADQRAIVVARVLGARHLAQAALTMYRPAPALLAAGAGVDVLHAASMFGLAVADRPRRRLALIDGLVAAAFALDGGARAWRA